MDIYKSLQAVLSYSIDYTHLYKYTYFLYTFFFMLYHIVNLEQNNSNVENTYNNF